MLNRTAILPAPAGAGACCCGPPTRVRAAPVHAVRLNQWFYRLVEDRPAVEGPPVLGADYARVPRRIDCEGVVHGGNGHIQPVRVPGRGFGPAPAGTTLHPVDDVPGGQRMGRRAGGKAVRLRPPLPSPPD